MNESTAHIAPKRCTDNATLTLIENLSVLGEEAHRAARTSGCWTDPRPQRGEMMMLMVSELARMHAGVRDGGMDPLLPQYTLASVGAAGFLIRVGDFVHGFGFDLGAKAHVWAAKEANTSTGIVGAMCAVADAMEADRKGSLPLCAEHLARAALIVLDFSSAFLGCPSNTLFQVAHDKIACSFRTKSSGGMC